MTLQANNPNDPPSFTKELRLPDGTVLSLADWVNESFRSAFYVSPWNAQNAWDLFTYARGTAIPGTDLVATRAHTNIPRSGDTGLPREWEMHVMQWRAATNMPLEQPILDWAAETVVQFEYNSKISGNAPLIDLLLGTRTIGNPMPVWMRENLSFQVVVKTENERVVGQLRDWLRGGSAADNVRDAVAELDAIVRLQSDQQLVKSLQHVQAKLQPGRQLLTWIHLEGPLKRCIL
jgi:hypothetical protein